MPGSSFVFSQFLHLLPRYQFQRIVKEYKGDYRTKHFKCWDQMACMMFAHIRQDNSLRDIDISLNAHANKLYHIGIKQCPKSTLAYANERRDYRIYEELAKTFYGTSPNVVKTQIWIAMVVYLVLAILKEPYKLQLSLSAFLHFLEINLFEQKHLISIFKTNKHYIRPIEYKHLTLFAF